MTATHSLIVTYGERVDTAQPSRHSVSVASLVDWLRQHTPRHGEKGGPWLCFADFNGQQRAYANLLGSYAVPLDLDLGHYAWDADSIRARLAGYAFTAWTSYSHTPERPRWRIVVPVERPMSRTEHHATWETLADLFLRDCGESSKDATRLNYLPGACLRPESAQIIHGDGRLFPVTAASDVPEGTAEGLTDEPVEGWGGPTDDEALIAYALKGTPAERAFGAAPTHFEALWTADAAYLAAKYPHHEQSFDHTKADLALANELAYLTGGHGSRIVALLGRSALAQRPSWREDKAIRAAEIACNGRTQYAFMQRAPAAASAKPGAQPLLVDRTDTGNANLLIQLASGSLRYVVETRQWLYWNDGRWHIDDREVFINTRALDVAEHYMRVALKLRTAGNHFEAEESVRWAKKCRNRTSLMNMVEQARKSQDVPISVTELDSDPWLLGVENGVVDLRTGELREQESREELVTKRCRVRYVPGATAPRWEQFVTEITGAPLPPVRDPAGGIVPGTVGLFTPRPALARYLQKALGYSITGTTAEQKLFLAVGEGSNGKSVVFDTVKRLLGSYARSLPSEALMATARTADSERPTALAAGLAGSRFVVASETKDGQCLDVGLVKNHTGDDEMTARRMRENPFTFSITHKLWVSTNNRPDLSQIDAAIRGRLHLIPFERRWNRPGEYAHDPALPDGDKGLTARFKAEAEGILAWLVAGAVAYRHEGLTPPAEVVENTRAYIASLDCFSKWLATAVEPCPASEGTPAASLFAMFATWCQDEGYKPKPDNPTAFAAALKSRNVERKTNKAGAKWGLRMR